MSGATLAYNLRRNKYVERQLFMELLARFCRWQDISDYLYIGFGGVYFEEFKLLHTRFRVQKMISLEREQWMLSRQVLNNPYGCITPLPGSSAELVMKVDEFRAAKEAENLLIWLDYVTPSELPTQLSEIRSIIPKLEHGDILKTTFSLHPGWLNKGPSNEPLTNRLEKLRSELGSAYLAEGISITDVTNDGLPQVFLDALKRKIAEGLAEVPALEFVPLGCYTYSDGTPMLTVTGALIRRQEQAQFEARFGFDNSDVNFTSPGWEIHRIAVPDMSLRERLEIDQRLTGKSAEQIATELSFKFEEDDEASLDLIRNYMKLYRFYPNYHRVQI
jgi:hypothetical protein